jgi:hypothetical protein
VFVLLRHQDRPREILLCAFDLLEFGGTGLCREVLEVRKVACKLAVRVLSRSGSARRTPPAERAIGSNSRTGRAEVKREAEDWGKNG